MSGRLFSPRGNTCARYGGNSTQRPAGLTLPAAAFPRPRGKGSIPGLDSIAAAPGARGQADSVGGDVEAGRYRNPLSAGTKQPLRRTPLPVLVLALLPRLWVSPQERRRPKATALPSQLLEDERGGPSAAGAEAPPLPRGLPDSPRLLSAADGSSSFCATVPSGGRGPGSSCELRVEGGGRGSRPYRERAARPLLPRSDGPRK